jgi:hypothetical protein
MNKISGYDMKDEMRSIEEALKLTLEALEYEADKGNDNAYQRERDAIKQALAAQRTWTGLTDEEIEQGCKESWVTEQAFQSAVWWAEARLKEKNT